MDGQTDGPRCHGRPWAGSNALGTGRTWGCVSPSPTSAFLQVLLSQQGQHRAGRGHQHPLPPWGPQAVSRGGPGVSQPGKGAHSPSLLLCPESERMGTTSPVALGLLQAGGQKEDPATAPEPTSSPRQPQKLIPRSGKRHHSPIPTGAETTHSHHHRPHRDHRGQSGAQHSRTPPTDSPYRSVPNSAPR